MPTPAEFYIDSILGCAEELAALKESLSQNAVIHFRGDYVGVGPSPLQTIDLLLRWSQDTQGAVYFHQGKEDHLLLIALGLLKESACEQLWWSNPYSGLIQVIDSYGIDGAKFLQSKQPDRQTLVDQVDRVGHLEFWKMIAAASPLVCSYFAQTHDSRCAYGGALNAYTADGVLAHSIPAKDNWFENWFEPRLQKRLTQHIGVGDLYHE